MSVLTASVHPAHRMNPGTGSALLDCLINLNSRLEVTSLPEGQGAEGLKEDGDALQPLDTACDPTTRAWGRTFSLGLHSSDGQTLTTAATTMDPRIT